VIAIETHLARAALQFINLLSVGTVRRVEIPVVQLQLRSSTLSHNDLSGQRITIVRE
jgi:hypothetical protein